MPLMGSNVHRNALGLGVSGGDYLRAVRRVGSLRLEVEAKLATAGVTALLTPTVCVQELPLLLPHSNVRVGGF